MCVSVCVAEPIGYPASIKSLIRFRSNDSNGGRGGVSQSARLARPRRCRLECVCDKEIFLREKRKAQSCRGTILIIPLPIPGITFKSGAGIKRRRTRERQLQKPRATSDTSRHSGSGLILDGYHGSAGGECGRLTPRLSPKRSIRLRGYLRYADCAR